LNTDFVTDFIESPQLGFGGRLLKIAKRAMNDCLTFGHDYELSTPLWSGIIMSNLEVVYTHNIGFRPCGMFREAYVSYLESIYERNRSGQSSEDVSLLKVNEITNWLRALVFMESCGFKNGETL
jgi:hypothetical protein